MKKQIIQSVHAREILDSRGNPTVEARITLAGGITATAAVPSGASTGTHEAHELRDGGKRYGGKGVKKAVRNVNMRIARVLKRVPISEQQRIDATMITLDGTAQKKKLGANAILAVSLASARAGALAAGQPLYKYIRTAYDLPLHGYHLPIPTMNLLNGGAHADWIIDFQEFMVVPKQRTFRERVRCGAEIFHELKEILKQKGHSTLVGDEGGYAVPFKKNEDALITLVAAIRNAGYKPGRQVMLAMDPAVSEVYDAKTKRYVLKTDKKKMTAAQMINLFESWVKKYPIESIEDALDQDDWDGWAALTARLEKKVTLVGDDLFVTNVSRLRKGIDLGVGNAILIKLNQIGSLSETIDAIMEAKRHRYLVSVSHRSGETADTFIADLAVAVNAEYIKTGSLSRSERVAKYNRLMEIEDELT
jgi:enolase